MIRDYFSLAVQNLSNRRLRSLLTMVGIFIGIALLVALVSLSQGLNESISGEFEKLGADKIFVESKGGLGAPGSGGSTVSLTKKDVKAIKATSGVSDASEFNFKSASIRYNDKVKYPYLTAYVPESDLFREVMSSFADIEKGRMLETGDHGKVVLGNLYQDKKVFGKPVKIRDKVEINGKEFEVIGFLEEVGNSQDDIAIYTTLKDYKELYDVGDNVVQIVAKIDPGEDLVKVSERIEKSLRKSRNLDEGKEDFKVSTSEDLMDSFSEILDIVQIFLIAIAAISLLVGGIGITNTMYTAVLERTKEIGVMKAIGARNEIILLIFLIESGLLGLTGGAIGILIGMGISKLVEIGIHMSGFTILSAYFSWTLILGSLAFSWFVGTVSGIMPALQASKQKPVDSLRYE